MEQQNKYQRKMNRRREKEYTAGEQIYNWTEEVGLDFNAVQTWHLRIKSPDLIVDIYPLKKRYHDVTKNERGGYEDAISFLKEKFKK